MTADQQKKLDEIRREVAWTFCNFYNLPKGGFRLANAYYLDHVTFLLSLVDEQKERLAEYSWHE